MTRSVRVAASLRRAPDEGAETIAKLAAGTAFSLLDDSLGWAWGYAGDDRLVGYLVSAALA